MQARRCKEYGSRRKGPGMMGLRLLMITALMCSVEAFAENRVVVIVHPDVADEALSDDDLRGIFWGDRTRWRNGDRIAMVLPSRSPIRDAFLETHIGRTDAQFRNHWRRIVFTGRGQMPREIEEEADLLAYVANTPGAVSFIGASALQRSEESVKILLSRN